MDKNKANALFYNVEKSNWSEKSAMEGDYCSTNADGNIEAMRNIWSLLIDEQLFVVHQREAFPLAFVIVS